MSGRGPSGRPSLSTVAHNAPLPSDLALPVQHLLPHGRYHRWQLWQFDAPTRNELLLGRLNSLLQAACDGVVSFCEQPCKSTSSCSPVPAARLLSALGDAHDDEPADAPGGLAGPSRPSQDACVVLRAEPSGLHHHHQHAQLAHGAGAIVGLAWVTIGGGAEAEAEAEGGAGGGGVNGRGGASAAGGGEMAVHLCICSLDDLAPPPLEDKVLCSLLDERSQPSPPLTPAAAASSRTPPSLPPSSLPPSPLPVLSGGGGIFGGARAPASPKSTRNALSSAADRLRARFETKLELCQWPAIAGTLFESLSLSDVCAPSRDEYARCLTGCDATQVASLGVEAALHDPEAPYELAKGLIELLVEDFTPIEFSGDAPPRHAEDARSCAGSTAASSPTEQGRPGVFHFYLSKRGEQPLFLRVSLVAGHARGSAIGIGMGSRGSSRGCSRSGSRVDLAAEAEGTSGGEAGAGVGEASDGLLRSFRQMRAGSCDRVLHTTHLRVAKARTEEGRGRRRRGRRRGRRRRRSWRAGGRR